MSEIEYPVLFKNERRVKLTGGASFEVYSDSKRPSIVETDNYDVEQRISMWLQDLYGTRHYDMGISKLTAKMSTMFSMLDSDPKLLEAFAICSHHGVIEELRESYELVISSTIQRDIDVGASDLEPRFDELRAEIYKHIKVLVEFVEVQLIFNNDVDMMLNTNLML